MKMKKYFVLFLCIILAMTCLAACGKPNAGEKTPTASGNVWEDETSTNNTVNGDGEQMDPTNSTINDKEDDEQKETPWIVEALKNGEYIFAYPFYGDLAFVRTGGGDYVIDKTGNIKISLGNGYIIDEETRFYNGWCVLSDCLINTKGEKIKAEDLGGTALSKTKIDDELLKAGYIVVDKVTSSFEGSKYESAIYNTKLEQVQPYSTELYALFHWDEPFTQGLSFYNGYVYYPTSRKLSFWEYEGYIQTYHIATNTFAEYDNFPETYVNKLDFASFSSPYGKPKGMYRNGELVLDLSQHKTLFSVTFTGDFGVAEFRNEEQENYVTIIDTQGNFLFEPILVGKQGSVQFNGNVLLLRTYLGVQDGMQKTQIKTFDLEGKVLGSIEESSENGSLMSVVVTLGEDTIVVENFANDSICYYNTKLEPLFPEE